MSETSLLTSTADRLSITHRLSLIILIKLQISCKIVHTCSKMIYSISFMSFLQYSLEYKAVWQYTLIQYVSELFHNLGMFWKRPTKCSLGSKLDQTRLRELYDILLHWSLWSVKHILPADDKECLYIKSHLTLRWNLLKDCSM